jgi:heat-inducible transcriptional repressor
MLTPRQKEILEIVVKEYVKSAEPVASSVIIQKYDLSCCSATVRNEMAHLEDLGYLEQPHSSAGRIPGDKAYRLFVDEIIRKKIALPPEKAAVTIAREYEIIQTHLEILLDKTARLLSQLTHYTSLILAPRLRKNLFKYLRLVSLSHNTVVLFMITTTGAVLNRVIEVSKPLNPEDLERITALLNDRLQGRAIEKTERLLEDIYLQEPYNELFDTIRDASQGLLEDHTREVFFGGRTRLLDLTEFKDFNKIRVLMELLEEEKVLAEILHGTISSDGIQVLIGEENPVREMKECSIITAVYSIDGEPAGSLGVIGPKRMPYEEIIPIVNFTAENFSIKLQKFEQL